VIIVDSRLLIVDGKAHGVIVPSVILTGGAVQPREGFGAGRQGSRLRWAVHARSLAPLEKARDFGMTLGY